MTEYEVPRTRLEQVLRQQHVTVEEFRRRYERVGKGAGLSERQAYRWVSGQLHNLPRLSAQGVLEQMFGEPVARLFGPPYGIAALRSSRRHNGVVTARGTARTDREGQVIAMSADKARDFLTRLEASHVGAETVDQLADDVRRLVFAYGRQPLPTLLDDLVHTQDHAFELLERQQRPEQSRDLYLVAGITCGLMAMASQDLGAVHDAMTQARAGYACADNAGHDGLRAWIRGLQANISYWSERWDDALRYAQLGADAAARSRGSAGVLLFSTEARALGALNRREEVQAAVARSADALDRVQPDDLDVLGGLCTFIRPGQLYYAAEAFSWGDEPEAVQAERFALEALEAFPVVVPGGSFRNEAVARCVLAVARVTQGTLDGAVEALSPVLGLPPTQRVHGIVTAVERVRTALSAIKNPGRDAVELAGAIEAFTAEPLTQPR
ncbi:MAG: hypothetical protein ACRDTC_13640 [Pseudonocardiaceae bacterium]